MYLDPLRKKGHQLTRWWEQTLERGVCQQSRVLPSWAGAGQALTPGAGSPQAGKTTRIAW